MALFDAYTTPLQELSAPQPRSSQRLSERGLFREEDRGGGAERKHTTDSHYQQQANDRLSGSSARELVPDRLTELVGTDIGRQSRETARRFT